MPATNSTRPRPTFAALAAWLILGPGPATAADEASARVEVIRTPEGGIQPQAVADRRGTIHLISFRGDPSHGDLFSARRDPGRPEFTRAIRVDPEPGSAVATGTIRGGQVALGRGGRVHVAWNGSRPGMRSEAPMLYARMNTTGDGFEPRRNLMRLTAGLDGGGTVAADDAGRVYVAWHARGAGDPEGEAHRKLWVARSDDDGATFAVERPAIATATGACACCGTRALVDSSGALSVLYRAATGGEGRDLWRLTSRDGGVHYEGRPLHPWRINACPMSSAAMADGPDGPVAAWETAGQVYYARVSASASGPAPAPISPPGEPGGRKHPSVAVAPDGSTLLVWTEGTGWQKGGALAWRLFDASGRPTETSGRVEAGIPTWSLPTVVARPDGGFTIIH